MKRLVIGMALVAGVMLLCGSVMAQDRPARGDRGPGGGMRGMMMQTPEARKEQVTKAVAALELTAEQKEKIAPLTKEFEASFAKYLADNKEKQAAIEEEMTKVRESGDREKMREVFTKRREIFICCRALKDLEDRKGAYAEGDIAVEDLDEAVDGGVLAPFEEVDHDRGIDQDHRALSFL